MQAISAKSSPLTLDALSIATDIGGTRVPDSLYQEPLPPSADQPRVSRERRNCAGGRPNSRLNTRLNAASEA
jgi:hypothetical protein